MDIGWFLLCFLPPIMFWVSGAMWGYAKGRRDQELDDKKSLDTQ